MIGYYVHHQGRGHVHRAQALAAALDEEVTGLSSLPRPPGWRGPWLELPRDDSGLEPSDVTAGGQLHWVPRHDAGLRGRSAVLSAWFERTGPRLVVVDISVEVALLARLHGVPVVTVVLPGRRADAAHLLGFRASSALVLFAPGPASELVPGVPDDVAVRIECVGAASRFPVTEPAPRRPGPRHVVALIGQGGSPLTTLDGPALQRLAPDWRWTVLGGTGTWVDDPSSVLGSADVVVTSAGQGGLADVAAHRRPAIVVPAERPFDEQATTAGVLERRGLPAVVLPSFPDSGWTDLLERAAALDGADWRRWHDGRAAERFAAVVQRVAQSAPVDLRSA